LNHWLELKKVADIT